MSEERKQIDYTVVCVSEFARRYNLKLKEAFQFLFQYKAIEFLKENYDIEHTLSLDDALDDMLMVCRKSCKTFEKSSCFIMTKQEQLVEYQIQDIIEYIVMNIQIEYDEAMHIFYNSQTFDRLTDIETGLYLESSAYVYGLFQDERNFGHLLQAEI